MKFKEIVSLACRLNGELCRKNMYLQKDTIERFGSKKTDDRVIWWANMELKYGECEIVEILPLDFYTLEVTIK